MNFFSSSQQPAAENSDMEEAKATELEEMTASLSYPFTRTAHKRFLLAMKYSVPDAFDAMQKHCIWREKMNIESITLEGCPNEVAKRFVVLGGPDRSNRPVIYVFVRKHDKNNRDIEEIKRFIVFHMELALKRSNPEEEKIYVAFDLTGFSLAKNMDYEAVRLLVDILQNNYQEILFQVGVVNAPYVFSACWALIKPWLDPRTARKVRFCDLKGLEESIDPIHFPPELASTSSLTTPSSSSYCVSSSASVEENTSPSLSSTCIDGTDEDSPSRLSESSPPVMSADAFPTQGQSASNRPDGDNL